MAAVKTLLLAAALGSLQVGCQTGYLLRTAAAQANLLKARVPLAEALHDPKLSDEQKRKLRLASDAHTFASERLGLKKTHNYETFVQLKRPYVSYVVQAAEKAELKPYLWWYPIIGSVPYKGYPDPESAEQEAAQMRARGYDTYVRGVSAFSTLGWFRDPILSSMLEYNDWDIVNTILHESTHASVYIGSQANFNERMAVFVGNKGTELFYLDREGPESKSLRAIAHENADERLFSTFISKELDQLEAWYAARKGQPLQETQRRARIQLIQERFVAQLRPQLSVGSYRGFESAEMNNARLLNYRLYVEDLADFEAAFVALGRDMPKFVAFCKTLRHADDPAAALKAAGAKAAPP